MILISEVFKFKNSLNKINESDFFEGWVGLDVGFRFVCSVGARRGAFILATHICGQILKLSNLIIYYNKEFFLTWRSFLANFWLFGFF